MKVRSCNWKVREDITKGREKNGTAFKHFSNACAFKKTFYIGIKLI